MNLRKSILFAGVLFAAGTTTVMAQSGNIKKAKTNYTKFEELKAANTAALGKGNLTSAQEAIDAAVVHEKTQKDPEAWTVYSLVYANIANLDKNAEAATTAIDRIKKATALRADTKHAENLRAAGQA